MATFASEFDGLSQHIIMHVDEATPESVMVKWTCRIHSALPEWKDTRVIFQGSPQTGALTALLRCGSSTSGFFPERSSAMTIARWAGTTSLPGVGAYVERGSRKSMPYPLDGQRNLRNRQGCPGEDLKRRCPLGSAGVPRGLDDQALRRCWQKRLLARDLKVEVPVKETIIQQRNRSRMALKIRRILEAW